MKFLSLPAVLVAALAGLVIAIPFSPLAGNQHGLLCLEVTTTSTQPGRLQAYLDAGNGFTEERSGWTELRTSERPRVHRIPLPPGTYRAVRLDPNDRPGRLIISSIRILASGGRVVRDLPLDGWRAAHEVARLERVPGGLAVETTPAAGDPQLVLTLTPPVAAELGFPDLLATLAPVAGGVFLGLAGLLLLLDRWPQPATWARRLQTTAAARPGMAILVLGAVAVVASCYPVVFLGRSFVSPNSGAPLLYDGFPTLPGYTSPEVLEPRGSDVGAILWQHVEYAFAQRRALADGEWPVWNRANAGGTPLLGQGQSMFGDPFHFLVLLGGGTAWAWDLKYLLAKWLLATGLGGTVLLLTRRLGAALLVTLAAPFIGFFVFRINHPAIFSLSYAAWILFAWLLALRAGTWRALALAAATLVAANWSVMHSGTAKEAYVLLLTMNFSGACLLLASRPPAAQWAKWVVLGWAGALFTLLSLPWWGTFLQTLRQAYTSYNAVSAFQLQPALALALFDEVLFRPLTPMQWVFNPSLNFLLLGGVLYFAVTLRQQAADPTRTALALSTLVPAAFAFGVVPAAWIVRVPFLGNIAHIDNSFACALILLGAVLAGAGFATAADRLRGPEGRGDLALAAILLAVLAGAWVAFGQAAHRPVYSVGATFSVLRPGESLPVSRFVWGSLASLLAALVVFGLASRQALRRGRLTPAIALLASLAVAVMLWRHGQHARAVGFDEFVVHPAVRADFQARSPAVTFLRSRVEREPARVLGLADNLFGGWTGVYGLEGIFAPDALANPAYRELTGLMPGVERAWEWRLSVAPGNLPKARPFLDALNLRYYAERPGQSADPLPPLSQVHASDLRILESPTAWPRAFFTDRVLRYGEAAEFIAAIQAGDGRPFAAVRRSDEAAAPGVPLIVGRVADRRVTPADDYRLTEGSTSFRIKAPGPGIIVLHEVLWPGDSRAEVDGRRVPVIRINHAFHGIVIEGAGDFRVTVRRIPRGFPGRLLFAGLGLALAAGSLGLAWRAGERKLPGGA